MCESWIYGCGHAIRTPCPRPKPTVPTVISSTNASGSNISNTNTSTQSSSRRNSSTTTSSSLLSLPRISKFCNGVPLTSKETSSPCYNCILADARLKIALEKPEVDAKKHELLRNSMSRTITGGPGGRYVDGYGNNNILAEEEYGQEFGVPGGPGGRQGQGRERGATTAFSGGLGSWNGGSMFGGSGYAGGGHGAHGGQDRRNSAGDAFKVGNDAFRGRRGGGFPNSFAHHCTSYNNNKNNSNNNNNGHQDGWPTGHGQQRGAGSSSPNGFGTRRNTYSSQHGGHPNGYANDNGYRQQNLTNDCGGIAWGHNGGGLGHGLGGGDSGMYPPGTNHFNTRPF